MSDQILSAEQRARNMLDSMGMLYCRSGPDDYAYPQDMSAGEVSELANLIAERDELLAALKSLNYTASNNCSNAIIVRNAIAKAEGRQNG